jgi:hypothetical protein
MNNPLEIRFVPKWLGSVISHYNSSLANLESIVSKQDVKLYKLANNLLRTKFELMRVKDFTFPAADIEGQYSEEDAVFALFGQNPENKAVPHFHLAHFEVHDDGRGGIFILEKGGDAEAKDLTKELLVALDTYRGRAQAFDSDSFKRYLLSVNNDHINTADENLHRLVQPPVITPDGGGEPSDGNNNSKDV